MNYLFLVCSVLCTVVLASFFNRFSKRECRGMADAFAFYGVLSFVCMLTILIVGLCRGWVAPSLFTTLFGMLFGCGTILMTICQMRAYAIGPMSYTTLIIASSLVIPSVSGWIFWHEPVRVQTVIGLFLVVVTLFLSVEREKNGADGTAPQGQKRFSLCWLMMCLTSFLCSGLLGVMQKIYGSSDHGGESDAFLVIAFATTAVVAAAGTLLCTVRHKRAGQNALTTPDATSAVLPATGVSFRLLSFVTVLAVICGVATAGNNIFNLYLAGAMPAAVFYPAYNGGYILFSMFASFTLFREKLSRKQTVGIAVGVFAILLLCINP